MVATRRGTRVEPEEEAAASGGDQTAVEVATQASPKRTLRSKSDCLAQDSGGISQDQGVSKVTTVSPTKNDSNKGPSQVVTRSRHRSGQSDADVSEAESTTSNSSTRVTRSRQSLVNLTDSARKLRSHRSALITEPILETKEDEELSEAESNCSSVSTRATRRTRATASHLTRERSRKSALLSETVSDHSEAESNCSSVSGLQKTVRRSTRTSKATRLVYANSDSQKEDISEAESCSSDFVSQPQTRRSSRQSKPQADETKSAGEASNQEQESPKKYSLRGVKVSEPLSAVKEHKILSTPRRSLRSQVVSKCSDIIVLSDSDSQGKTSEHGEQPADKESVQEKKMSEKPTSSLAKKLPETSPPTKNDAPEEMIDLTEETMDEPRPKEQDQGNDDDDDDDGHEMADTPNKDSSNAEHSGKDKASNVTEKVEISLLLDSDESDESEQSDEETDIEMEEMETQKEIIEEQSQESIEKKTRIKQVSAEQSKDLVDSGLFVIDTAPGLDSSKKYYIDHDAETSESEKEENEQELSKPQEEVSEPEEEEEDFIDEEVDEEDNEEDQLLNKPKAGFELSSSIDTGLNIKKLGGLYISFDAEKPNPGPSLISKIKKESKKKDELLKKSVITPDFEKKESVPPYRVSLNKLKKQRKEEREKTTGRGWFDMKAPEMTEELKNDLKALKMRSAMDPKHFYKKDDRDGFPKYFQVATVVDNPLDHYHSRIPKKQRKRTIVEELLADSEFRRYNKKKYQEIMAEKAARAEGKKNRKKKKFRT